MSIARSIDDKVEVLPFNPTGRVYHRTVVLVGEDDD